MQGRFLAARAIVVALLVGCGAGAPSVEVDVTRDEDADGIARNDHCPNDAEDLDGYQDDDGCPDRDDDEDGVPDASDLCRCVAEDRDGFEDEDGCPDLDNDQDRIVDACDRCPFQAEVYNGNDDEDGCPDGCRPPMIDDSRIVILESIWFRARSSRIGPEALPILDALAATMQGNPSITRVRLTGHADRGERDGRALSLARASAVRDALVQRGVDAGRLEVVGDGADRPRATGRSASDRAHNRRVTFHVVAIDGVDLPTPVDPEASPVDDSPGDCAEPSPEPPCTPPPEPIDVCARARPRSPAIPE
jgi:outer membrane protein OmpA-like peptidoglycan-associated protein